MVLAERVLGLAVGVASGGEVARASELDAMLVEVGAVGPVSVEMTWPSEIYQPSG